MISCNYNGWADVPEDEREGLDVFEATRIPPAPASVARPLLPARIIIPQRKAA
jgi:hypothetical protein